MTVSRRTILLAFIGVIVSGSIPLGVTAQMSGLFVVNAVAYPGGDSIDVYLGASVQYEDVRFGHARVNPYDVGHPFRFSVAPGNSTGAADTLAGITVTLPEDSNVTIVVSGDPASGLELTLIQAPDYRSDSYRFVTFNAIEDRSAIDVADRGIALAFDNRQRLDASVEYYEPQSSTQELDIQEAAGDRLRSFVSTFGPYSPRSDVFVLAGFVDPLSTEHKGLTMLPVTSGKSFGCDSEPAGCRFRENVGTLRFVNTILSTNSAALDLAINGQPRGSLPTLSASALFTADAGLTPATSAWTTFSLAKDGITLAEDSVRVLYNSSTFLGASGYMSNPESIRLSRFAVDSTTVDPDSNHIEIAHLVGDVDSLLAFDRDTAYVDLVLASPGAVGSSRGAWNSSAPRRPFAIDLFDPHDSIPFASKILLVDELGEEVVVFVAAGLRDPETAGLNPAIAGAGLFRVPPSEGSLQRLPNALPPGIDYGDLPDPPYVTIDEGFNSEHRGARHMIDGFLYLGSGVDGESNGQPTDAADGDDLTGDGAPDDGIVFLDPFVGGSRSTLKATLSYRGYLTGWIDFDKDHVFSESEAIIGSLSLPAGPTELSFQVPLSVSIGDTLYARFRLRETGTPGPNTSPTETKLFKGEVEDYRIIVASGTARDALPMNETKVGTPYPNPASVRTAVRVVLRKQASVTVSVFDLLGRVVLVAQQDRVQPGGETEVAIDLTTLAPGFYFTSVEVNGRRFVNPLVVTR